MAQEPCIMVPVYHVSNSSAECMVRCTLHVLQYGLFIGVQKGETSTGLEKNTGKPRINFSNTGQLAKMVEFETVLQKVSLESAGGKRNGNT
ncbi:hypothetical protein ElyMa_003759600 [Elysia marginata]|uniref:Uncharacterized protein n=1 Tax=Elysia marginata TaxID=1093978 RepID=A0AAV4F841_9GAST|nr:hypothetical protein ElyMa_003759600 [Elysia marginata]